MADDAKTRTPFATFTLPCKSPPDQSAPDHSYCVLEGPADRPMSLDDFQPSKAGTSMLVLYERPRDYPQHFVVRAHDVVEGRVLVRPVCALFHTLEYARSFCRGLPYSVPMARMTGDDPRLVEVWL